jgi:hypothetical protein
MHLNLSIPLLQPSSTAKKTKPGALETTPGFIETLLTMVYPHGG